MNPFKIGLTIGDPGGIGPEIIIKALSSKEIPKNVQYIIFGSSQVIKEEEERLKINITEKISIIEPESNINDFSIGKPSKNNGQLSFLSFKTGIEEAMKGNIRALVTAPVSKESWFLANYNYLGHTDYLSKLFPDIIMSFWSKNLKIALFTHHMPLKKSLQFIKKNKLISFLNFLNEKLKKLGLKNYEFLICGLNPHAGENGLLGEEEKKEIIPAIKECQEMGVNVRGPFSPDTIFLKFKDQKNKFIVAMYHDQALIPFKLISFEQGVNFTLGLPFIRTSPAHGVGFDIAGKGIANPSSIIEAIKLACQFSKKIVS
ncbi:4-hydroxythreonine-4-phosphate dehydrogenase PdxA [SCandidatus Aminicenantes bacterium Aminicenantia_JdfR_composite]|jgi:4-hydroxythreonine-4-phosphate dehydrogenase|nr:4-hydroxythreonine-4-phosphate dehydrogenase PdxA [SCandidatus Aminicenantes bacterium Aminicenantia_JdfR_composite]MCP2597675.1 4-hydroxythreonine-4-phosphate dehydrogenase PdxA [Candidatus Aminicenantes bacterium AC-335-G13]MCP2621147.1 4-hydroxythreonine-4-phosphate dehydrogenase PdxA [Candidatus Aminicenantes bacterium AC-334-E05]